jgi:hypothetical protein
MTPEGRAEQIAVLEEYRDYYAKRLSENRFDEKAYAYYERVYMDILTKLDELQ